MFSIDTNEYDCTRKCRNVKHGAIIGSSLTKRSVSDKNLAAFIAKTCRNFADVVDYEGRSALHFTASVGRYAVAEWLINHGANLCLKDKESGQTPLHRSIYYGNIDVAVLLLRYGANPESLDNDCRTPYQYACTPTVPENSYAKPELFVWGSNKNYNLGIGDELGKQIPQLVDYFRRIDVRIIDVTMSTYHSIFLTEKGVVYVVGHGNGGRLGTGSENVVVAPISIQVSAKSKQDLIASISSSKNHSLLLTGHNMVLSSGSNTHCQLGIKPAAEKQLSFKEVFGLAHIPNRNFTGVIAKDYHSIVYDRFSIYVWGLNGGQFGMKRSFASEYIQFPLLMPVNTTSEILLIDSSNAAIVFYTTENFLYICYNFKIKTIKAPYHQEICKLCVTGGYFETEHKDVVKSDETLKVVVVTASNYIYIWYEDIKKYVKCNYLPFRYLEIDKILCFSDRLCILSGDGLYTGTISNRIDCQTVVERGQYQHMLYHNNILSTNKVKVELKLQPNLFRVSNVWADPEGENFAVLQENPKKYITIPQLPENELNFSTLFNEAHQYDAIHDLLLYVQNDIYPVHKFIIFTRAPNLRKMIGNIKDKNAYLNYSAEDAVLFQYAIKFVYTGYHLTDHDFVKILKRLLKEDSAKNRNHIQMGFNDMLVKLGAADFDKRIIYRRELFPELYDVTVKCAEQQEFKAHKCVLVARLEYFNMMFNQSWSESNYVNITTVPIEYMKPIVDFLYTKNASEFLFEKYSETYIYNMLVICDQFFIEDLKKIFEKLLLEKVSIRKCGEMLEFSLIYNCAIVETVCFEFICFNLARVLESRILENLEPKTLAKLNVFYKKIYQNVEYRAISPYSYAIDDKSLENYIKDFVVDLDYKIRETNKLSSKIRDKYKLSRSRMSKMSYEKEACVLMKDLTFNDSIKCQQPEKKPSLLSEDDLLLAKNLEEQSDKWQKVVDKKDTKKRIVLTGLKVNDILKSEEKGLEKFIRLDHKSICVDLTPVKESSRAIAVSPPSGVDCASSPESSFRTKTVNMSDLTIIQSGKLSQKQRKRLSSESTQAMTANAQSPESSKQSSPQTPQPTVNVWASVQQPAAISLFDLDRAATSGQRSSEASPKKKDVNKNPTKRSESDDIAEQPAPFSSVSFNTILQDTRKQKDYMEHVKSKSLALTQIEEMAIEDLKRFYNVENVHDESIAIERKQKIKIEALDFVVWQHGHRR